MNMKTNQPPASEALAAKIDEAIARGEDPLGDDEPLEVVPDEDDDDADDADTGAADGEATEAGEGTQAAGEGDATTAAADSTKADEPALDVEALEAIAADEPDAPAFEVDKTDFKAERAKLSTDEKKIEDDWAAGNLSDAERGQKLLELRDRRDDLTRQETRAETIADLNRQQQQTYQTRVLRSIATQSKTAGQLDYSDAKVGSAYDAMLRAVAADPNNEGKKFHELAQLAHEALCATRGVKAAPAPTAAAATPAAPAARKSPAAPITLRDLPVAATPNTGGDALDALGKLEGQAYQEAYNRLSPAQQARLLDEA